MKNHAKTALMAIALAVSVSPLVLPSLKPGSRNMRYEMMSTILHREASGMDSMTKQKVLNTISHLSEKYTIDPLLILSIMYVESHFQPDAKSNKGALGLMQVKPVVLKDVASQLQFPITNHIQILTDKEWNIHVGVCYFSKLLKMFHGDISKALMAYNSGPTTVSRVYKNRSVPEGGYQGKVLRTYKNFSRTPSPSFFTSLVSI